MNMACHLNISLTMVILQFYHKQVDSHISSSLPEWWQVGVKGHLGLVPEVRGALRGISSEIFPRSNTSDNAQGYRWKIRWKEANLDKFINPEFLGADATGQRGLEGPFLGDNCFPPGLLWVDTKGLVGSGQKGLVGCFFRGLSLKWFFNHSMHYEVAEK